MFQSSLTAAACQLSRCAHRSVVAMATAGRRLCTGLDSQDQQQEQQQSEDQLADSKRRSQSKFRYSFLGGDHNQINLVGTVSKVTEKQIVKSTGSEPYVVLSVVTLFRYKDLVSGTIRTVNTHHRVSAFNPNLVKVARMTSPGDRVFVSGRMDYFYVNQSRVATVTPTRIVPMLPKSLPELQKVPSSANDSGADQHDDDGYDYYRDSEFSGSV